MASPHISLAKASFAAFLFRPDVSKVSRDDLSQFHAALDTLLVECSPANIQTCKHWLLKHVIVSAPRVAAFGKFLVSLSKHLSTEAATTQSAAPRQRLHILYLVNDVLHHNKYHTSGISRSDSFPDAFLPFLNELFQLAGTLHKPKVVKRLNDLIEIWDHEKYFTADVVSNLQVALSAPPTGNGTEDQVLIKPGKAPSELPYMVPATHGDPSLPFYDLPAANLMHLIVPNSSQPVRTEEVKALQFSAGPADEGLVTALKDFLKDVDSIDTSLTKLEDEDIAIEMDEMGQISYQSKSGDPHDDTYYGWSRSFCNKMKSRDRGGDADSLSNRSRSRSISRTSSRGRVHRKRRRYSDSGSEYSGSARLRSRSPSQTRESSLQEQSQYPPDRVRIRPYSPVSFQSRPAQQPAFELPKQIISGTPFPPPPPSTVRTHFPTFPAAPILLPLPPPNWTGTWPPPPPPPPPPPGRANFPTSHGVSPFPYGRSNDNAHNGYGRQA